MRCPPLMSPETYWLACYVMLSRATSLEGLLILRPAERASLSRRPPQYLIDEIDRLLAMEKKCCNKLRRYLETLPDKVPECILSLFAPNAMSLEKQQVRDVREKRLTVSSSVSVGPGNSNKRSISMVSLDAQANERPKPQRRITGKQTVKTNDENYKRKDDAVHLEQQIAGVAGVLCVAAAVATVSQSDAQTTSGIEELQDCATPRPPSPHVNKRRKSSAMPHNDIQQQDKVSSSKLEEEDVSKPDAMPPDVFGSSRRESLRRHLNASREKEKDGRGVRCRRATVVRKQTARTQNT